MTFETWYEETYPGGYSIEPKKMLKLSWGASRAEAEAEIAALQLEREELREALREGLRCVHDLLAEQSNDDLIIRPFLIGCQLWFREKSFLVSTPASGEPARKP